MTPPNDSERIQRWREAQRRLMRNIFHPSHTVYMSYVVARDEAFTALTPAEQAVCAEERSNG